MAVTARFQADFSSFLTAVQAAEVKLRTFEDGAGKAGASVNKMANSLSGTSLIQQASVMAEAVERVGGTSRLTESELRRVAGTASEAAAKLRAMGQDVPPGIQRIADAAKNITPALSNADKAANFLKSTFAQFTLAGLATNAISALTSSLGEFASVGFNKLPAVQASFARLTASMKQDGAEMLDNMNTATKGLVSNYDLMLSANKAMLLGLPVTSESMGELAKTASVLGKAMGQDATKSLDDLITALGRSSPMILDNLGLTVKVGEANEAYAEKLGKSADALTESEKKMAFYKAAMEAARRKTTELGDQTTTLGEIATRIWTHIGDVVSKEAARINNAFGPDEQKYAKQFFGALGLDTAKAAEDFRDLGRLIDTVTGKMSKLPAVPGSAPPKPSPAGVTLPGLSIKELLDITDGLEKKQQADDKAAAAARRHAEAVDALFRKFSGANATAEMQKLDAVFRRLADSGQLTESQISAIVKEALKLQRDGAKLTDRLWAMVLATDALGPGLGTTALDFAKIGTQIDIVIPKVDKVWDLLNKPVPYGITHLKDELARLVVITPETMLKGVQRQSVDTGKALGDLAQAFAQLGQIAGGSLGAIVRDFGIIIGSIDTAKKAAASLQSGMKSFKDGDLLSGLVNMSTGILGIASAAIAAGKALANLFDRNKGRDLVVDFAETFGGFDQLHAELLELGDEGEQLWIKLTQGVGRNNPDQARKAIDEVTAALSKKSAASDEATIATEAEAQATIETAAAAAKALDDVNARLAVNREHWSEWSEDVTGYLQRLSDTIRAMPIPSPTGVAAFNGSGTGLYRPPAAPSASAPGSRSATVVQFVTSNMQVLAEGVIPEMPAAKKRLGVG